MFGKMIKMLISGLTFKRFKYRMRLLQGQCRYLKCKYQDRFFKGHCHGKCLKGQYQGICLKGQCQDKC